MRSPRSASAAERSPPAVRLLGPRPRKPHPLGGATLNPSLPQDLGGGHHRAWRRRDLARAHHF
eukprot:5870324-Pyramimonas_sp.AAC.1